MILWKQIEGEIDELKDMAVLLDNYTLAQEMLRILETIVRKLRGIEPFADPEVSDEL